MLAPELVQLAERVLAQARARRLRLTTAESCTGGLVAACLTEPPGASDVFDRGFVTYSNAAKSDLLGVPNALIENQGAVSAAVAGAMVEGALSQSGADVAVAVTGIAGPGGGSAQKPVGLVYIATGRGGSPPTVREFRFGGDRTQNRIDSVRQALTMLADTIAATPGSGRP